MAEGGPVEEVPAKLKELAGLVGRTFYDRAASIVVDMLVINSCLKESQMCELLKFDGQMLRSIIKPMEEDLFLKSRHVETKVKFRPYVIHNSFYYIDYANLVNMVYFKLEKIKESFQLQKQKAVNTNSLQMIAQFEETIVRFENQSAPLYVLLYEVIHVELSLSLLDPEPNNLSHLPRDAKGKLKNEKVWKKRESVNFSGKAEKQVSITIGDDVPKKAATRKERPIWMTKSTVFAEANDDDNASLSTSAIPEMDRPGTSKEKITHRNVIPDVFQVETALDPIPSDAQHHTEVVYDGNEESMESNEDEDPMVMIGNEEYPLSEVNENKTLIARMTPAQLEAYVELYQKVNVNDDF